METKELDKKGIWFVAQTIPHAELKMRKYFEGRGIVCFVPTKLEMRKQKGETIDYETPIIPYLVFFKADYTVANGVFDLNYRMINRLRDSKGLLCVPEEQMSAFIRFVNSNRGKVRILDSCRVTGERVMVKKGPLAGLAGKLVNMDGNELLVVGLNGLVMAAVKFPKNNLIRVEEVTSSASKVANQ